MSKKESHIVVNEEQLKSMSNDDVAKLMEKNRSYCIHRNPDGSIHEIIDRDKI